MSERERISKSITSTIASLRGMVAEEASITTSVRRMAARKGFVPSMANIDYIKADGCELTHYIEERVAFANSCVEDYADAMMRLEREFFDRERITTPLLPDAEEESLMKFFDEKEERVASIIEKANHEAEDALYELHDTMWDIIVQRDEGNVDVTVGELGIDFQHERLMEEIGELVDDFVLAPVETILCTLQRELDPDVEDEAASLQTVENALIALSENPFAFNTGGTVTSFSEMNLTLEVMRRELGHIVDVINSQELNDGVRVIVDTAANWADRLMNLTTNEVHRVAREVLGCDESDAALRVASANTLYLQMFCEALAATMEVLGRYIPADGDPVSDRAVTSCGHIIKTLPLIAAASLNIAKSVAATDAAAA